MIAWLIVVAGVVFGPNVYLRHQVSDAATVCACACGLVGGDSRDWPAPLAGETWTHHDWWGEHAVVCFAVPPPHGLKIQLRAYQAQTDANAAKRWKREGIR